MPANPDVGKGFDFDAITGQLADAGVDYIVFPPAAISVRLTMTPKSASSIRRSIRPHCRLNDACLKRTSR